MDNDVFEGGNGTFCKKPNDRDVNLHHSRAGFVPRGEVYLRAL